MLIKPSKFVSQGTSIGIKETIQQRFERGRSNSHSQARNLSIPNPREELLILAAAHCKHNYSLTI
jgi:hypothetical protein